MLGRQGFGSSEVEDGEVIEGHEEEKGVLHRIKQF
jgi:hypothetical protein